MTRQPQPLSEEDEALALCLARGFTRKKAAKTCNVCVRTIYNRMSEVAFRARVQELRADLIDRSVGKLATEAGRAVLELGKLLQSPSDSIRLRAARTILEKTITLRQHAELEARLAELEHIAHEREIEAR